MAVTTQPKPAKTTAVKKPARPAAKPARVAKPVTKKPATTAKPVVVKAAAANRPASKPAAVKAPRPKRPLIAVVRRSDGRGRSFSERLAETRHKQFKHAGPVCHNCRMSANALALAAAPTAIAG
jgi:hypothetical protein